MYMSAFRNMHYGIDFEYQYRYSVAIEFIFLFYVLTQFFKSYKNVYSTASDPWERDMEKIFQRYKEEGMIYDLFTLIPFQAI